MQYLFTSKRLGFRNWKESDLKALSALNQDQDVMEFFSKILTIQESRAMIDRMRKHAEKYGHTFFAVETLNDQEFIGFIGLIETSFEAHFTPCKEIGWRLKKEVWNQGFATEGALACLNYGFTTLNFSEIYSFTALLNRKSQHLMKKLGLSFEGNFQHPKLEIDDRLCTHVLYRIDRATFMTK